MANPEWDNYRPLEASVDKCILSDVEIRALNFITPFEEGIKRKGIISYGLSSFGYDARIGYRFKVFSNVHCGIVDPKGMDPQAFVEVDLTPMHDFRGRMNHCVNCQMEVERLLGQCPRSPNPKFILVPPNSFVLGETVEEFDIPRDVMAVVLGKSTYARCGIIVNVTPLEPEWKGRVTVEISNTSPLPAKVYAGEGIMQILFFRGKTPELTYASKGGKYQDQKELTLPKID